MKKRIIIVSILLIIIIVLAGNTHRILPESKDPCQTDISHKDNINELQITPCSVNPLSFYSTHNHQRTGSEFKVRHIPFVLHFNPQD